VATAVFLDRCNVLTVAWCRLWRRRECWQWEPDLHRLYIYEQPGIACAESFNISHSLIHCVVGGAVYMMSGSSTFAACSSTKNSAQSARAKCCGIRLTSSSRRWRGCLCRWRYFRLHQLHVHLEFRQQCVNRFAPVSYTCRQWWRADVFSWVGFAIHIYFYE